MTNARKLNAETLQYYRKAWGHTLYEAVLEGVTIDDIRQVLRACAQVRVATEEEAAHNLAERMAAAKRGLAIVEKVLGE